MALERRLLALCQPFLDDPSAAQSRLCRRISNHIKELFVFVAHPEVPPDNKRRRAQPAPSGDQPQDQRRHPLTPGHRDQDGAGLNLRHLANTRPQHPHRLPTTPYFPSSLNCYLDPVQLQNCFISWTQAIAELLPGEVVAIDGKTARRSYDRAGKKGAIHRVSAWATQQTLTLGQVKTDEKSNEITAISSTAGVAWLHRNH